MFIDLLDCIVVFSWALFYGLWSLILMLQLIIINQIHYVKEISSLTVNYRLDNLLVSSMCGLLIRNSNLFLICLMKYKIFRNIC